MRIQTAKFKRALLLNRDRFGALPDAVFRLTRTPRFGRRARNIILALNLLRFAVERNRGRLGQIAEFGVAKGEGFRQLVVLTMHYCATYKLPIPRFYGFDTFEGLPASDDPSDVGTWSAGDYPGDEAALSQLLQGTGASDRIQLMKGLFSQTLPTTSADFAPDFILVDCDYYTSTRDIFDFLKDRLESGTIVYFDDLGTNFFNPHLGEERVIHEVNNGHFGPGYYLHPINQFLYYWSNAERPLRRASGSVLDIPLAQTIELGDCY